MNKEFIVDKLSMTIKSPKESRTIQFHESIPTRNFIEIKNWFESCISAPMYILSAAMTEFAKQHKATIYGSLTQGVHWDNRAKIDDRDPWRDKVDWETWCSKEYIIRERYRRYK